MLTTWPGRDPAGSASQDAHGMNSRVDTSLHHTDPDQQAWSDARLHIWYHKTSNETVGVTLQSHRHAAPVI